MKIISKGISYKLLDVAVGPKVIERFGVGIALVVIVIVILVVSIVLISKAVKKNHEKAKYSNSKNDGIEK
ncbi:MAG: hypothetical protein BWY74_00974 [Firmicutes bacterium ADurb.Bin419]|nr:MAG: hypothetical protein BWY74_00974 [Firmicutes bacterium ADurb.Bin419]